ncbi:MAG: hypothetical protein KC609_23595 [Myxococcales bacterium]|nr:hypothetical protein [Myxococcales bacterium]
MFYVFVLICVGLVLLAIEAFLIPGFGLVGVLGIFALVGGVVWAFYMVGPVAGVLTLVCCVGVVTGGTIIVSRTAGRKLILKTQNVARVDSDTRPAREALIGRRGVAMTVLRPSGKIEIDGVWHDVTSSDAFIDQGRDVEVVKISDNTIFVREAEQRGE